jgi:hypothetical protein
MVHRPGGHHGGMPKGCHIGADDVVVVRLLTLKFRVPA